MDYMKEYNAIMQILMDPSKSEKEKQKAAKEMEKIAMKMQEQAMSGSGMSAGVPGMAGMNAAKPSRATPMDPFANKPAVPQGAITEAEAEALRKNMMSYADSATKDLGTYMDGVYEEQAGGRSGQRGAYEKMPTPDQKEVLLIAKRYYEAHSKIVHKEAAREFSQHVGAVAFDGKLSDIDRGELLCNKAAVVTVMQGDCNFAVAVAAAAIGWMPNNPRAADMLASVLDKALFITGPDRLRDAEKLCRYAVSLEKKDAKFFITLAQIIYDRGDLNGALEAIDEALRIQPDNHAALKFKLEMLTEKGGGGSASEVSKKLKDADGELSKRDTKQERESKGMKEPKDNDSADDSKRKLDDYCRLEYISSADMIGRLDPSVADALRDLIKKEERLPLLEFPPFLKGDAKPMIIWLLERNSVMSYINWLREYKEKVSQTEGSDEEAFYDPFDMTAADYMMQYNGEILHAAEEAFRNYCNKITEKHDKEWDERVEARADKHMSIIDKLHTDSQSVGHEAARIIYERALNIIQEEYMMGCVKASMELYNKIRMESERLWKHMLPFARCTESAGRDVAFLYFTCLYEVSMPIYSCVAIQIMVINEYYPDTFSQNLEQAIAEYKAREAAEKYDNSYSLPDVTISLEMGPLELKIGPSSIELECVEGAAARTSYNWKTGNMEVGVGAGVKGKAGFVGVEAKGYANVVFGLRSGQIHDAYLSGEVKGSAKGMERGMVGKVSVMGNGASLSTTRKVSAGGLGIEHEKKLIGSGSY